MSLKIAALDDIAEDKIELTRDQWLRAQANDWKPIWMYPAIVLAVIFVLFFVGFHDKTEETEDQRPKAED